MMFILNYQSRGYEDSHTESQKKDLAEPRHNRSIHNQGETNLGFAKLMARNVACFIVREGGGKEHDGEEEVAYFLKGNQLV